MKFRNSHDLELEIAEIASTWAWRSEMTSRRDLVQLRKAATQLAETKNRVPEAVIPEGGIVEFATSPEFLGIELFPLQATILKIATLAVDLFTPFDYEAVER